MTYIETDGQVVAIQDEHKTIYSGTAVPCSFLPRMKSENRKEFSGEKKECMAGGGGGGSLKETLLDCCGKWGG